MSLTNTMKTLSESERPYEKCERLGAACLSDAELLAVLLRTGSHGENALDLARRVLYYAGEDGILGIHHYTVERLKKMKGIGRVKAIQMVCVSELAKRLAKARACEMLQFTCPSSIAKYYMEDMRHELHEVIKLVMVNSRGALIGESDISKGTVNASVITPREIFIEALKRQAVGIVVMHNHPSGDPAPSEEDIVLTKRVKTAGSLIGIELLDHIIIGNNCYVSLREEKLF